MSFAGRVFSMGKRNYGRARRATRSHGYRDQCFAGKMASSSLIPNRRTLGLRATKQKFTGPYSQRIACELIDRQRPAWVRAAPQFGQTP